MVNGLVVNGLMVNVFALSWPRRNKGKANVRYGQKTEGDKGLFFCKDLRKMILVLGISGLRG